MHYCYASRITSGTLIMVYPGIIYWSLLLYVGKISHAAALSPVHRPCLCLVVVAVLVVMLVRVVQVQESREQWCSCWCKDVEERVVVLMSVLV